MWAVTAQGQNAMRRFLGLVSVAVLALGVTAASADNAVGPISRINLTNNTFVVDGQTFTASPTNTVGVKLRDLKEGDNVRVNYSQRDEREGGDPINAMRLEKIE